jgi:hypothetical protein
MKNLLKSIITLFPVGRKQIIEVKESPLTAYFNEIKELKRINASYNLRKKGLLRG